MILWNCPAGIGVIAQWLWDFAAYDWHLLQNRLTICYKLGRIKEVGRVYRKLEDYAFRHPEKGVPVVATPVPHVPSAISPIPRLSPV